MTLHRITTKALLRSLRRECGRTKGDIMLSVLRSKPLVSRDDLKEAAWGFGYTPDDVWGRLRAVISEQRQRGHVIIGTKRRGYELRCVTC